MCSVRLLLLSALLAASSISHARPVTYEFTTVWSGELAGEVSTGRFTFDYDLSKLDKFGNATPFNYFDDLTFKLRDKEFTELDVKILDLKFDKDGKIARLGFGNHCSFQDIPDSPRQASCSVFGSNRDDFYIRYWPAIPRFTSSVGGEGTVSDGVTSLREILSSHNPNDVPEPSAPALLLGALGAFGLIRRLKLVQK